MEANREQNEELEHRDGSEKSKLSIATDGGRAAEMGGLPIVRGFLMGVGAFVVGYIFTYLFKSDEVSDSFSGSISAVGSEPETYQGVGWIFAAMHHATVEASAAGQSTTATASDLEEGWLVLVPLVTLLVAGYLVATRTPDYEDVSGAIAGATIVTGYLVCIIALVFLSEWSTTVTSLAGSTEITIKPKTGETIAIAGIAYPLVLGFVGGAIGDS